MKVVKYKMLSKLSIQERLAKYQLAAEDFYIDSSGNIDYISTTIVKATKHCPEKSIERLAVCMWAAAVSEIQAIFGDLSAEEYSTLLIKRQRGYYASLRFCMETIADLEYLYLHPKEIDRFMTDGDEIGREIDRLRKDSATIEEFDDGMNRLLQKGKINSRITDRIAKTLPGCLRDYALFCLYSHPSMEGFRLYYDEEGVLDLLYQKVAFISFKVLASFYRIFLHLNLLNSEVDETFSSIVFWALDCHRRIVNIQTNYTRKDNRKERIEETFNLMKKWAHESKIE